MKDQRNAEEASPKWEDDFVPKGRMICRNRGIVASISKAGSLIRANYVCQTPIMWVTTHFWREIWF